jgi:predicted small integral membrane protein
MDSKAKTIGVLYLALAGFSLMSVLAIPMQYAMMNSMLEADMPIPKGQPDPREMMGQMMDVMKYVYVAIGVLSALFSVVCLVTGICMYRRKCRTVCIIGAGLSCLAVPLGTALGIWTLLFLFDEKNQNEFS